MSEHEPPDVGSQLRFWRHQRGLSLRGLAELCDLSPNAISLIERGVTSPSVSTLHRLSTALDVPITALLRDRTETTQVVLTRAAERPRSGDATAQLEALGTGLAEQSLEPFLVTLMPGADSGSRIVTHVGQEMAHCLAGEVEYDIAGHLYRLAVGDTLLFEAGLPHRWRNPGEAPATFLMVYCSGGRGSPEEQHLAPRPHPGVG